MAVYESREKTKDGRGFFFKTTYIEQATNKERKMVSKKYSTLIMSR